MQAFLTSFKRYFNNDKCRGNICNSQAFRLGAMAIIQKPSIQSLLNDDDDDDDDDDNNDTFMLVLDCKSDVEQGTLK